MSNTSHVVVLDSEHPDSAPGCYALRCDNCGVRVVVKLPIAVSEFSGITRGFVDRHRECSAVETLKTLVKEEP